MKQLQNYQLAELVTSAEPVADWLEEHIDEIPGMDAETLADMRRFITAVEPVAAAIAGVRLAMMGWRTNGN